MCVLGLCVGMAGGKYRSFLVHIKAVSDKSAEDSPRPVVRMPSAKPISTKTHSLSTLLQRAQASKVAGRGPKIGNQSDSNPKTRPLRQAGGDNP